MKPKIIDLPAPSSKPPHTCIVTGRRDGQVVDFGKEFTGQDPHIYIRRETIESAGELCGMVRESVVQDLRDELEEANGEAGRLRAIVSAGQELSAAEDKLREALGPSTQGDNR